jgi:predicted dehydrogenase
MHGHAYKKYAGLHNGTILSACCDIDENKAAKFREQFGFEKHYTDYRAMLAKEKPDAVCLNAPVPLTAALAIDIMERGFPLLLEKPPGRTPEETIRILETAKKTGLIHQVAFNRRFIPVVDFIVNELRANYKNEEIKNIGCEFFRYNRRDPDFSTTAIHGIDTVRHIAGSDYREIHFFYQETPEMARGAANFYLCGEFCSGAFCQLRFCPASGVRFERITVNAGDSTYLVYLPYGNSADSPGKILHYRGDRLVREVSGGDICGSSEIFMTNGFYREDAAFFDAVKAGRQPACDLQSGLQSVEIMDCLRKRTAVYRAQQT